MMSLFSTGYIDNTRAKKFKYKTLNCVNIKEAVLNNRQLPLKTALNTGIFINRNWAAGIFLSIPGFYSPDLLRGKWFRILHQNCH
jgi:hypothetical protein